MSVLLKSSTDYNTGRKKMQLSVFLEASFYTVPCMHRARNIYPLDKQPSLKFIIST